MNLPPHLRHRIAGEAAPKPSRNPFAKFNRHGRGTKRKLLGEMNKVEAAYADHLESLLKAGEIAWYRFEAWTFKLAPDTRFTPDFIVMLADGMFEAHEVKGGKKKKVNGVATGERTFWIEEDAKLKIKVAAEMMPLRFSIVYPIGGGQWGRKDFWEAEPSPIQEIIQSAAAPVPDRRETAGLFAEVQS